MPRHAMAPGTGAWLTASGVLALMVLAPIAALAVAASRGSAGLWPHLIAYVLPDALRDTALLLAGVAVLTSVIGAGTAWLVSAYDFPGRRVVNWALLLPLAVPTYVIAFAYLDLLHPVGPVQTSLRWALGYESPRDFRLPDLRSMAGCIGLLGFVLYPYVYLTTRAMFVMQAANLVDAARTLADGRARVFWRVALPLARPAMAIGVGLALLEALNDIGASEFLGVRTLTVTIYATWVTRSDLAGATQMALVMLAGILALVYFENVARARRRYASDAQHPRLLERHRLAGWRGWAALVVTLTPIVVGFAVPTAHLADQAIERLGFARPSDALISATVTTVTMSLCATALTLAAGVVVAYAARLQGGRIGTLFARAAALGYAVPGTVLAIGLLPVLTTIDPELVLLASGAAVVLAYVVRFLTVAAGGVEAGFSRVSPSVDDAARLLGDSAGGRLWRIHLPLARPALASAALLVFVDCMKELPATLLLRPVGVETLATHLYGEAARGTYEEGALAALLIVIAGLLPVLLFTRLGERSIPG